MARRFDPSPRRISEWRHDLVVFRDTYVTYLNDTLGKETVIPQSRRSEVVRRAQAAQMVFDKIGATFTWEPPPVTHTGLMHGLVNTVFVHETPFGGVEGMFGNWLRSYEGILHTVDSSLAALEKMDEEARRRRRNPFYWGDRALTALLGFPAYLLGLIFGVPRSKIEDSVWGTALRIVALVIDSALVVLGLNAKFNWF